MEGGSLQYSIQQCELGMLRIQEQARTLTTKILDAFIERLRQYIVFKLKEAYGESNFITVAQGRGPPDAMKVDGQKPGQHVRVPENPDQWDMSILINIFYDHFDQIFGNRILTDAYIVGDFNSQAKPKALLLNARDIRNRRAHDNPMSGREAYRLADLTQQFFEALQYKEVVNQFEAIRLEALELMVYEEKEKISLKSFKEQAQQISQQQMISIAQIQSMSQNNFYQGGYFSHLGQIHAGIGAPVPQINSQQASQYHQAPQMSSHQPLQTQHSQEFKKQETQAPPRRYNSDHQEQQLMWHTTIKPVDDDEYEVVKRQRY